MAWVSSTAASTRISTAKWPSKFFLPSWSQTRNVSGVSIREAKAAAKLEHPHIGPPFRGESGIETLNAILKEPAPKIPTTEVPDEAVGDLQRILDKCLAKDPGQRYQTAKDLLVDLGGVRRSMESGTISKWPRRKRHGWPVYSFHWAPSRWWQLSSLQSMWVVYAAGSSACAAEQRPISCRFASG